MNAVTTMDSGTRALEFLGLGDDPNVVNVSKEICILIFIYLMCPNICVVWFIVISVPGSDAG